MGDEIVHQFNTFIAAMFGLVSLVVFLYLIDYAARLLRPVSLVYRVGESGIGVIKSVYRRPASPSPVRDASGIRLSPERIVANTAAIGNRACRGSGGLVERARHSDGDD